MRGTGSVNMPSRRFQPQEPKNQTSRKENTHVHI